MEMAVRGIRGAITVVANDTAAIHEATTELLLTMVEQNGVVTEDVAGCFITATPDLNATFPAVAIRQLEGWPLVPLMCAQEMEVPGSLSMCIRIMMIVNSPTEQADMRHVYLRGATVLRPDLVVPNEDSENRA